MFIGWVPTFLIRAFGLSEEPSTKVGFAFSNIGLKSQDQWFGMKKNDMVVLIMFHDCKFGVGIVTTHLTYHCLKCFFFHTKIALLKKHNTMLTQLLSFFFHVEKKFRALACQMCGNYSKAKSEIMKHYQRIFFFFFSF